MFACCLKSRFCASEDEAWLSSEGAPEKKKSVVTSCQLLLSQNYVSLVLHKDVPKKQDWVPTKANRYCKCEEQSWWLWYVYDQADFSSFVGSQK